MISRDTPDDASSYVVTGFRPTSNARTTPSGPYRRPAKRPAPSEPTTQAQAQSASPEIVLPPPAKRHKAQWTSAETDRLFLWHLQRASEFECVEHQYAAFVTNWTPSSLLALARQDFAPGFKIIDEGLTRDVQPLQTLPYDESFTDGVIYLAVLLDRAVQDWLKLYGGQAGGQAATFRQRQARHVTSFNNPKSSHHTLFHQV